MKAIISSFPIKVVGAILILSLLLIVEVISFSVLDRHEFSSGAIAIIIAASVFFVLQLSFSLDISAEAIAVWDYVATLTGAVAALVFFCGGILYMNSSYTSIIIPRVEDRLDDAAGLFQRFVMEYCVVIPTIPASRSNAKIDGDTVNSKTISEVDSELKFMCERAEEISKSIKSLDRPANAVQVSELYFKSIESLPDHIRFLSDKNPSDQGAPQSLFRQGTSLISIIHSLLSRGQRFTESAPLLSIIQSLTKGPLQFLWGLLLWNAASLKCGIILAKRR